MLFAERSCLASHHIENRLLRGGVICATLAADVNQAVLSMLIAVHRRLAAFDSKARMFHAGTT